MLIVFIVYSRVRYTGRIYFKPRSRGLLDRATIVVYGAVTIHSTEAMTSTFFEVVDVGEEGSV
jgi:hypothetical protein